MIRFTPEELAAYVPMNNNVLVKANRGRNELRIGNGEMIKLDFSFEPERNAPVSGTVYAVPQALEPNSMEWDTECECFPGDTVYFDYKAALNSLEQDFSDMIVCGNEAYMLIPYDLMFVAKRMEAAGISVDISKLPKGFDKDDLLKHQGPGLADYLMEMQIPYDTLPPVPVIIPLNGYNLVEPLTQDKFKDAKFAMPDHIRTRTSARFGRITHLGKVIKKYNVGNGFYKPETDNVKVGDVVAFDEACDLPVEYGLHASLDGNKIFFRIQRRYFLATITPAGVEALALK